MSGTIFGKIISREIPAKIVYEDESSLAFRDVNPAAPTHILIVPKTEIPTVNDLTEAEEKLAGHLIRVAAEIAKKEGIDESGYRLVINCNSDGGQSVYHLHVHLIGGKPLGWPPFR
jgi:histidine triad (HIT) family protein